MRRGLGRGKGRGYYNLVPRDPFIHGLSAKGVKTDYRRYDIYRLTRHAENPLDEEFGHKLVEAETIVTPVVERDEFGEYMADEYGYQDYSNIVNFRKLLSNVSGEEIQELCKVYEKEASKLDAKEHISKELFEEKLQTAVSNDERLEVLRSYRPLYAKDIKEKIKAEQERVKTMGSVRMLQDVLEGRSPEEIKKSQKIISEGVKAIGSMMSIQHAVSTALRFEKWADERGIISRQQDLIDRQAWNKGEPIFFGGKNLYPVTEFKQTGYGAWHIGSEINKKVREGKQILIINTRRNRRFLYAER